MFIGEKEYRSYGELRDLIASKLTIDSREAQTLLDLFSDGKIHRSLKKWAEQGSESEREEINEVLRRLPDPDKIDYTTTNDSELMKQIIESFNQRYTFQALNLQDYLAVRVLWAKFNEEELTISSEGIVCHVGNIGSLSLSIEIECKKWLNEEIALRFYRKGSSRKTCLSDSAVDLRTVMTSQWPVVSRNIVLQERDELLLEAQLEDQSEILWSRSVEFKKWQVGDYYNVNGKEGVVFWVDQSGTHGKIVSMTGSGFEWKWTSDMYEQRRLIGADNQSDGAKNMAVVKRIPGWQSKYPAFKWCADLGEGWYLPAIEELKRFTLDDAVRDVLNRTLAQHEGKRFAEKGTMRWYWSSTESGEKWEDKFCAWYVNMSSGNTNSDDKNDGNYVRAVSAF